MLFEKLEFSEEIKIRERNRFIVPTIFLVVTAPGHLVIGRRLPLNKDSKYLIFFENIALFFLCWG